MSPALSDVLKQLDLQPGERRCVIVDDYQVEISRTETLEDDPGPMANIWLNAPPSEQAKSIQLRRGETELPKPIAIEESDLAPE